MKTVFLVYIALVVLAMSSCQKENNDTATVPDMNAQCISNPSLCQQNLYQQNAGFNHYNNPNQNGYQNGQYGNQYGTQYGGGYYNQNNLSNLCNCPDGSMPTYNNYAGLGCVQSNQIYGSGYAYFSWGASNTHWTNVPQLSNVGNYSQNTCYNGVVQSCLVDRANTCSTGYTCRVSAASSRLGLCVSNTNTSNSNYGQTYR
ncbi:MAG: hypothetical protein H7328_07065 [Bdellovibrio sp.]|nr:hypothetical protein [Bdellovibrio sp.]